MTTTLSRQALRLALAATLLAASAACSSGPSTSGAAPAAQAPSSDAPEAEASPTEDPGPAPRVLPGWDPQTDSRIEVASTDFEPGGEFPRSIELDAYGCHGENVRPEIHWGDLPEGTESVVLTFTAEGGGPLNRFTLIDIPTDVRSIPAGADIRAGRCFLPLPL